MRVSLVRSGGVGGLRRAAELDTAALPAAEAAEVESLVGRLEAAVGGSVPPGTGGADRFRYDLTVEGDAGTRRLSLAEGELGPEARALLARLEERVRGAGG